MKDAMKKMADYLIDKMKKDTYNNRQKEIDKIAYWDSYKDKHYYKESKSSNIFNPLDHFNMIIDSLSSEDMIMLEKMYLAFNGNHAAFIEHIRRCCLNNEAYNLNEKRLISKIYDLYETLEVLYEKGDAKNQFKMTLTKYMEFRRNLVKTILRWRIDKRNQYGMTGVNDYNGNRENITPEINEKTIPDDLDEDGNVIYY